MLVAGAGLGRKPRRLSFLRKPNRLGLVLGELRRGGELRLAARVGVEQDLLLDAVVLTLQAGREGRVELGGVCRLIG